LKIAYNSAYVLGNKNFHKSFPKSPVNSCIATLHAKYGFAHFVCY